MRVADILGLAMAPLWQQKARTFLTLLGIVFGSFVLAASLSITQGVTQCIERQSHRSDLLRRIHIYPGQESMDAELVRRNIHVKGEMGEAKRERIREALVDYQQRVQPAPQSLLTQATFRTLVSMEHVETVKPVSFQPGLAILDTKTAGTEVATARPDNLDGHQRLVAGRFFVSPTEHAAVVSEFLLYRWGLTDDAALSGILGKTLVLELGGLKDHAEAFPIVGVLRTLTAAERQEPFDPFRLKADVVLPIQTGTDLFFRVPRQGTSGIEGAIVLVDREENVRDVYQRVMALGLTGHYPMQLLERQRLMYLMIFGAMTCVAGVALLVAALGIANTMLMSVLERTREIGIMKAVGASNGQLQLLFLVEGALIGLCGSVLGLLLAWGISLPGDAWVRSLVARELKIELTESIFLFTMLSTLTVPGFVVLVTTLAAVFPARRAARVDPVAALRHE